MRLSLENDQLRKESEEQKHLAERLMQENQIAKQMASQLTIENNNLKKFDSVGLSPDFRNVDTEIQRLVEQLAGKVAEKASEQELASVISFLHQAQVTRNQLAIKGAEQLISPHIQANIVILEHSAEDTAEFSVKAKHCTYWNEYFHQIGITDKQIEQLTSIKEQHFKKLQEIYEERENLNKEIKKFYKEKLLDCNGRFNPIETDASSILKLSTKLEQLRSNLNKEHTAMSQSYYSQIMTPFQEAMVMLKQFANHKNHANNIQLLSSIWEAIHKHVPSAQSQNVKM